MKKRTLEDLRQAALSKGGKCLSDTYIGIDSHYSWACSFGHVWEATANSVLYSRSKRSSGPRGSWCPECAGLKKKTIADMARIAESRDGELISSEYKNCDTHLSWMCNRGHIFSATPYQVEHRGNWCGICNGINTTIRQTSDISKVADMGAARGFRLVSTEYVHSRVPVLWECKRGHQFEARSNNVQQGKGCKHCGAGRGERMVRSCFEYIFRRPFPISRPPWLHISGRFSQHLDGFCEELSLAFEYDGEQHFKIVGKFGMTEDDLARNIANDKRKDNLCLVNGVALVRIKHVAIVNDLVVLKAVTKAIRSSRSAISICKALDIALPRVMTTSLAFALENTGDDGTGQLFLPISLT